MTRQSSHANGGERDAFGLAPVPPAQTQPEAKRTGKRTDDDKRADFSRLASRRASAALAALRSLGNLANQSAYSWTLEQENAIFAALEGKVAELRAAFAAARNPPPGRKAAPRQLELMV